MLPPRERDIAILLLVLAAVGGRHAFAAELRVPPADTRAQWTVGIAAFRSEGLAPEDAWLGWSVPLLLRGSVAGLGQHTIDAEGRMAIARDVIARERRALLASIAGLRKARDDAELARSGSAVAPAASTTGTASTSVTSPGTASPSGASTSTASPSGASTSTTAAATLVSPADSLPAAMERLAWLDSLDPSAVPVSDTKPLALKEGSEPGMLLAAPFGSPAEAASREGVDLLVGGSVREASGYYLIDVWAWDAARETQTFAWRDAATRAEVYDRVAEAGKALTGVLLGRPWAALVVATRPPAATVLVDGKPAGTGKTRFGDLVPGRHEVRAVAPGYQEESRTVDLAPGTETSLELSLAALDLGSIAVTSDPPGADAWLDAVWQGRTPLDIPRPGERARLIVALPEGPETAVTVGPFSPDRLSIPLSEAVMHSDEKQKAARDRFYGSFGWLVLSLPVPFYTYNWAYDWAMEANRLSREGNPAGAARAAGIGYGLYYAYLGGLGISVGLAAWTVYNLVRYLRTADRSAEAEARP